MIQLAIYVTGDTHRDFSRLSDEEFPESQRLTKEDCVIICGDFGGLWDSSTEEEQILDELEARPFTTLFVDGNHENYDLLSQLEVSEWNGGNVQFVRPSVIHLMRGQFYNIEDLSFFTMGGASSHDVDDGILEPSDPDFWVKYDELTARHALFRVNHLSWWEQELPDVDDYSAAWENLSAHGWEADYILTHCAPTSIIQQLGRGSEEDALTDFLQSVREDCKFTAWFLGHYHTDGILDERFVLLYRTIMKIT